MKREKAAMNPILVIIVDLGFNYVNLGEENLFTPVPIEIVGGGKRSKSQNKFEYLDFIWFFVFLNVLKWVSNYIINS